MSSNASPADSFSLPSAGGVVNLLNDAKSKKSLRDGISGSLRESGLHLPGRIDDKHTLSASSSTNTLNIPSLSNNRSESTSSDSSAPRSPFSAHPSGGESHGSSMTSIMPSTDSSRDDSLESGKASRTSTEEDDNVELAKNHSKARQNSRQNSTMIRNPNRRTNTTYSSSPSEEDEEDKTAMMSNDYPNNALKRRRDSDSRADETVQSRKLSMNRLLDAPRLAKSPPPIGSKVEMGKSYGQSSMDKSYDDQKREKQRSSSNQNRTSHDVPMNMHRATNVSHGGYGGNNELDESEIGNGEGYHHRDMFANGNRRRASTSESTGSSKANIQNGRKATSNSQIIGGKKRYPCSFPGCDKTFSTSGHAARHNRIHTGSKPYRCTFPGCNASFSRQDNSLQHYRTHVLHPKSRAGGTVNLDASQIDSATLDSELSNLDPEMVATVQMGRKALEEGTAIAVVQEFIDGNGRRAEAVQRMVGQPKHGRRGSNTASGPMVHQWDSDKVYHQQQYRRRISVAGYDQMPYDHGMNGHSKMAAWQGSNGHPSHWSDYSHGPQQPTTAYANDPNYYRHEGPNAPHHFHSSSYPGETYRHNDGIAPYPPPHTSSYSGAEGYNSHHHSNGHHSAYRHSFESPHSPSQIVSPSQQIEKHRSYGYRERHNSGNVGNQTQQSFKGPAPPHPPTQLVNHNVMTNGQTRYHMASHSPPQHNRRFSMHPSGNEFSNGHRRSISGTSNFQGMPFNTTHSGYSRPHPSGPLEPIDAPSPSFSVRSFRSEGPYGSSLTRERDDRNANALSMLSNAAAPLPPVRTDKIILPSPTSSHSDRIIPPRKPVGGAEMHLPLPNALSKVPCSSDRSTNTLTPTPLTPSFTSEDGPVASKMSEKPFHPATISDHKNGHPKAYPSYGSNHGCP